MTCTRNNIYLDLENLTWSTDLSWLATRAEVCVRGKDVQEVEDETLLITGVEGVEGAEGAGEAADPRPLSADPVAPCAAPTLLSTSAKKKKHRKIQ